MEKYILNRTRCSSERLTLVKDGRGMGGAGQAEGHYSRQWYVAYGVDRGNGYQGGMNVDYALGKDHVPAEAKAKIREILGISVPTANVGPKSEGE